MRPLLFESWTLGGSFLHRADPRAKLATLLVFLGFLAAPVSGPLALAAIHGPALALALAASGLPLSGVVKRTLAVMSFALVFSAITWLAGDPERAALLLSKSGLSSCAIVLFAGTTPLRDILRSIEWMGAPPLLVRTTQFLYRYLFVLLAKARQVQAAAACRGGFRWDAAGGAAAGLFGSAYGRAEGIHRAMLSRGAAGHIAGPPWSRARWDSLGLPAAAAMYLMGARLLWNH